MSSLGFYFNSLCNLDIITKYRFYMAARIDTTVISKLAATDLMFCQNGQI